MVKEYLILNLLSKEKKTVLFRIFDLIQETTVSHKFWVVIFCLFMGIFSFHLFILELGFETSCYRVNVPSHSLVRIT